MLVQHSGSAIERKVQSTCFSLVLVSFLYFTVDAIHQSIRRPSSDTYLGVQFLYRSGVHCIVMQAYNVVPSSAVQIQTV